MYKNMKIYNYQNIIIQKYTNMEIYMLKNITENCQRVGKKSKYIYIYI